MYRRNCLYKITTRTIDLSDIKGAKTHRSPHCALYSIEKERLKKAQSQSIYNKYLILQPVCPANIVKMLQHPKNFLR